MYITYALNVGNVTVYCIIRACAYDYVCVYARARAHKKHDPSFLQLTNSFTTFNINYTCFISNTALKSFIKTGEFGMRTTITVLYHNIMTALSCRVLLYYNGIIFRTVRVTTTGFRTRYLIVYAVLGRDND